MNGDQIILLLKEQLSSASQFALPDQKEDGIGRKRWTTWKSPTWIATVKPATVEDIQSTVKCCSENSIPFHAVATGHHYTTAYEKAKGVLEIDISSFNSVTVDADANTMTVGGAARFVDVFDPLYQAGKETPVGGCSTAGVVGVTLGGGLNRWAGIYGLLIDNLLEVEMVTASGELVTASQKENTELFWGMRGAGFNFGIVTKAMYRVYDHRNGGKIALADMILPFDKAVDCVRLLKQWEQNQPPALSMACGVMWNEDAGGPAVLMSCMYLGSMSEGEQYFKPFLDMGPIMQDVSEVPLNELHKKWAFGADAMVGQYETPKNFYSTHVKQIDVPTYEWYFSELAKLYERYPGCRQTMMMIEDWATKAASDIPDDSTAYPHRDVVCQTIFMHGTEDPSQAEMLDKWAKEARYRFGETNGFGEPRVYVSYGHGDESQETWYGARKLDRLRALKKKWDPKQHFSFNNPIVI